MAGLVHISEYCRSRHIFNTFLDKKHLPILLLLMEDGGLAHYDAMIAAVNLFPEVASVGLTDESKKIPVHHKTDKVSGIHIVGHRAADMDVECVMIMEFGATLKISISPPHGHPPLLKSSRKPPWGLWNVPFLKCKIYMAGSVFN